MALKEYKCPNCGAPLLFDPDSQSVICNNCQTVFDISALNALIESEENPADTTEFDWGSYQSDLDLSESLDTKVYNCHSCGAIIEANPETAATTCPYCGNNVVLDEKLSSGLKPNGIIPFKIKKDDIRGIIDSYYKDKKLLPKNFFSDAVLEKVQGVYVPFWLFNGNVDGDMAMNAAMVRTYVQGDYDVTETSHYLLKRQGAMTFGNVPVDASVRMDNDLMDSVEPYDFNELKPFDPAYLTGFVADRFDTTPDEELNRAETRMMSTTLDSFRSTATLPVTSFAYKDLRLSDPSVKYALLPVYVVNCEYKGVKYRYAINGQTGKMVGELPIGKAESRSYFWKTFIKYFGIFMVASTGLFSLGHVFLK